MSTPAPGIICRRARLSDYAAVLAINPELYSGMDYLAARYKRYLSEPERLLYVMEKDGKIVAFVMRFFVDGGETGVNEAGRMNPSLQGKGLFNYLSDFMEADSRRVFPQMKKTAWTSLNRPITDMLVKKYPTTRLKAVRPRITFDVSPRKLTDLFREPTVTKFEKLVAAEAGLTTRILTPSEAVTTLSNIRDFSAFAPEEQLIVDWEPFRQMISNFEYITKHSTVFATHKKRDAKMLTAFSFGTYVQVKAGIRHRIDFYCKKDRSNTQALLAHIHKHLMLLHNSKFKDVVNVSMLLPGDFDQSQVRRILVEELGLGPLATDGNLVKDALLVEQVDENETSNQSKL